MEERKRESEIVTDERRGGKQIKLIAPGDGS